MGSALISSKQWPFVHAEQAGFDDVMLGLLQVVLKQLRREVLFSLGFSPEDVGTSMAVIARPNACFELACVSTRCVVEVPRPLQRQSFMQPERTTALGCIADIRQT